MNSTIIEEQPDFYRFHNIAHPEGLKYLDWFKVERPSMTQAAHTAALHAIGQMLPTSVDYSCAILAAYNAAQDPNQQTAAESFREMIARDMTSWSITGTRMKFQPSKTAIHNYGTERVYEQVVDPANALVAFTGVEDYSSLNRAYGWVAARQGMELGDVELRTTAQCPASAERAVTIGTTDNLIEVFHRIGSGRRMVEAAVWPVLSAYSLVNNEDPARGVHKEYK